MLIGIDTLKRVDVYRNLNKPGLVYSVRQGGRVRDYVNQIVLTDARFKHATAKQLGAVRSGPRQVCQWVSGFVGSCEDMLAVGVEMVKVDSDPKKVDGFTVNGIKINAAAVVVVGSNGCYAMKGN